MYGARHQHGVEIRLKHGAQHVLGIAGEIRIDVHRAARSFIIGQIALSVDARIALLLRSAPRADRKQSGAQEQRARLP